MPRSISQSLRNELEASSSSDYIVLLLEITHSTLSTPIRVANDLVDYYFNGNAYVGYPFMLEIMSDDDRPPRGRLSIQNVDQRIGEAVRGITTPLGIQLTALAQSDYAAPIDGLRSPVGTPTVEYVAAGLLLREVSVDAIAVQGELTTYDISSEPWPAVRSTPDLLPGLES